MHKFLINYQINRSHPKIRTKVLIFLLIAVSSAIKKIAFIYICFFATHFCEKEKHFKSEFLGL